MPVGHTVCYTGYIRANWSPRAPRSIIRRGRKDGQCDMLIKLLSRRFGTLPEHILAQVRSASEAQLERWAERILTAPTLDAVLDDAM